jgi:hypothetical protein
VLDDAARREANTGYHDARHAWLFGGRQGPRPEMATFLNALNGQQPAQTNPALPPQPIQQQPFQLPQMQPNMVGSSYGVNNLFPALSGYELPRY